MENTETFGTRFKNIRKTLGLTQEEIGKKIQMEATAISLMEQDKREPSLKTIRKICTLLGCKPEALIDV